MLCVRLQDDSVVLLEDLCLCAVKSHIEKRTSSDGFALSCCLFRSKMNV